MKISREEYQAKLEADFIKFKANLPQGTMALALRDYQTLEQLVEFAFASGVNTGINVATEVFQEALGKKEGI